jgi:hypothetical protein
MGRLLYTVFDDSNLYSSLMMEAVHTSETSVDNHFTWQYNPEDNSEHLPITSKVIGEHTDRQTD